MCIIHAKGSFISETAALRPGQRRKAEPSSEILILTTESTTESQRLRMDMELGGGTKEGVPRGLVG